MIIIRAFDYSEADYTTLVALDSIAAPEFPMTVDDWRYADETRDAQEYYHRDLIALDGVPVGYAEVRQFENYIADRKVFFDVVLLPDHDTLALHAAYHEHLLELLAGRDVAVLCTGTLSDRTTPLTFLAQNGFVEVLREQFSALDLTQFDPVQFDSVAEKVAASGVAIIALPELQARDPQWKQKLYELDWAITQDIPASTPPAKLTLDAFEQRKLRGPNAYPEGWFVAVEGEQYVGLSYVIANPSLPDTLYTGATGVIHSHRRRGIATALKLRVFALAQARGFATINTSNASHNPMLQLNYALGFRDKPAWISFEKRLTPAPESV